MSHDLSKASPPAGAHPPFYVQHSWTIALTVAIIMVGLALLGVGLTTAKSEYAKNYWYCLVPVFGLLSVLTAWVRSGPGHPVDRRAILRQILHWIGIGCALGLDFYITRTGEETTTATGLNALLVLALGCFLAGIHHEPLFALVGLLLTAILILVVKAEQYLWLAFVIGGVAIAGLLYLRAMVASWRSRHKAHASK